MKVEKAQFTSEYNLHEKLQELSDQSATIMCVTHDGVVYSLFYKFRLPCNCGWDVYTDGYHRHWCNFVKTP